jgi:hypothetical protein
MSGEQPTQGPIWEGQGAELPASPPSVYGARLVSGTSLRCRSQQRAHSPI